MCPTPAVDVLAFYLGYSSWPRLVVDFSWTLDKAQAWLTAGESSKR